MYCVHKENSKYERVLFNCMDEIRGDKVGTMA